MKIKAFYLQKCPVCGNLISAAVGSKEAICRNCGYKDATFG